MFRGQLSTLVPLFELLLHVAYVPLVQIAQVLNFGADPLRVACHLVDAQRQCLLDCLNLRSQQLFEPSHLTTHLIGGK
jgi:hypothetical protein